MFRLMTLFSLLLLTLTSPALAEDDALGSCRHEKEGVDQLAACTAVVSSPEFTAAERATAFRIRGELRQTAGALGPAIEDLSSALSLSPNDPAAYASRARVHLAKGDLDAAVTDFSAALQHQLEKRAKARLFIGRGHTLMVKALYDQALADFDQAIALAPESASAYNHRGLVYRKMENLARAIEDYTKAITLNPVYALAYSNRGHAHESMGHTSKAVADFSRALLLDGSLTSAAERLTALNASSTLVADSARLIAAGKDISEKTCAFCHAVGSTGRSPNAKAPTFRSLSERHPFLSLREPLSRGIAAPHEEMPSFSLSEGEIDGIVAYVNSLSR